MKKHPYMTNNNCRISNQKPLNTTINITPNGLRASTTLNAHSINQCWIKLSFQNVICNYNICFRLMKKARIAMQCKADMIIKQIVWNRILDFVFSDKSIVIQLHTKSISISLLDNQYMGFLDQRSYVINSENKCQSSVKCNLQFKNFYLFYNADK